MVELRGTPFVKLGTTAQDCSSNIGAVPAPCEPCRQSNRWLPRTISWTSSQYSRFKSIMQTILRGHDEILQSLCGFCADQQTTSCDCFVASYTLLGLPLTVETEGGADDCLTISEELTLPAFCDGEEATQCVKINCLTLCGFCERVTFDPCNNPDHLDIMLRAQAAAQTGFKLRATGDNILIVVDLLFPGVGAIIRHVDNGTIYIDIGRPFTVIEARYLAFFTSLIPTGFGVTIKFVTLC